MVSAPPALHQMETRLLSHGLTTRPDRVSAVSQNGQRYGQLIVIVL